MESVKMEGKIVEEEDRRGEESKDANLDRTDDAKTKEEVTEVRYVFVHLVKQREW